MGVWADPSILQEAPGVLDARDASQPQADQAPDAELGLLPAPPTVQLT